MSESSLLALLEPTTIGMRLIPGGTLLMGSDVHYPEVAPQHRTRIDGFRMDAATVTNAQFATFAAATGYVTVAERPLDPAQYPGAPPENLQPGALVFHMTEGPVDTRDISNWCRWTPGACWRSPEGPDSDLAGRADHPVVQVAYEDAEAFARWTGKDLPGPLLPRESLRPLRSLRQRLGMDEGLVGREARHRSRQAMLRPQQPAWSHHRGVVRPGPAARPHPAKGRQGRILPLRAVLLPSLQAGRTPCADGRYRHEPYRLPLRSPGSRRRITNN